MACMLLSRRLGRRFFGSRSAWKGPFFDVNLLFAARKAQKDLAVLRKSGKAVQQKEAIRTDSRGSMIIPEFVGLRFEIHNGKDYKPLLITEEMIGHKLGEFAPTRKRAVHPHKTEA
mmetsp:Transcript_12236/g.17036  ORF Transcript_12236/g.17036 Transcript_12236/m.17036 type:complete len:116 (+) Transcript_12236:52-399(+)|eukprot:CAMPEP_0184488094 /NCGR_PEP_ID=MMETSP0113_2-20130426/10524_1 /TAXON_ID=91329 /ORGANISM="Norrisiella sphaerica, Strain BC52" /LENGTH=115 /DNA_ID=CAMNT_0026870571 /DNA_START=40 /DNA_END=387 /DNA_ORIENTATION=+